MKICFLANADSVHTYRWVTPLLKKGHKISIITFQQPDYDYGETKIFLVKKYANGHGIIAQALNFFPTLTQLLHIRIRYKPDIYHALGTSRGWFAALIGFRPLIISVADPGIFNIPFQRKLPLYYKLLNTYAFRKANILLCDGYNTKEERKGKQNLTNREILNTSRFPSVPFFENFQCS